jgi:hypothetical protein
MRRRLGELRRSFNLRRSVTTIAHASSRDGARPAEPSRSMRKGAHGPREQPPAKPDRLTRMYLSRMNFLLLPDQQTAPLHRLRAGGLGEASSQVSAALPLERAQLRPCPLARDMPVLNEPINPVTDRHEEVAVACRLLDAFDGAAEWNSHMRESRNRAGCSPARELSVRPDPAGKLLAGDGFRSAPPFDRRVVVVLSCQRARSASSLPRISNCE